MTGLLDDNDSFHDHDNALIDQSKLLKLYQLFGSITKPHLAHAIQEERRDIGLRDWVSAASNVFGNLLDEFTPEGEERLEANELRATKNRLVEKIEEDIDEVNSHELDILVENTSRSIVNAWLTDLNRHYDSEGLILNSFLMRRGSHEGLIERALLPYAVDDFRDVFVCAMNTLSEELFSSDIASVALPMKMNLFRSTNNMDEYGEFIVYREEDILETKDETKDETNDETVFMPRWEEMPNRFALESFCLRQLNLWKVELVNNFTPNAILSKELAIPTSIQASFLEKTEQLARHELSNVKFEEEQFEHIMCAFVNNIRIEEINEIAVKNGISIQYEDNDMRLKIDDNNHTEIVNTDVKLFRAMRAATENEILKAS